MFLAAVLFALRLASAVKATSPVGAYIAARAAIAVIAGERGVAYIATRAAVEAVKKKVGTFTAAICRARRRAIAACPLDAVRGRCGADVSACAAVVRI